MLVITKEVGSVLLSIVYEVSMKYTHLPINGTTTATPAAFLLCPGCWMLPRAP